jgi:hypothetical protein
MWRHRLTVRVDDDALVAAKERGRHGGVSLDGTAASVLSSKAILTTMDFNNPQRGEPSKGAIGGTGILLDFDEHHDVSAP